MSHIINYLTCAETVSRAEVMADIQRIAAREGDGYSSRMTWHDKVQPFETYEEAEAFIKEHDNGWYDDHAVRYLDYSRATKTAKMEEYAKKISELIAARAKYFQEHKVQQLKAKYIGCPKCGSKLSKEHLLGQQCPLCRADLRSESTQNKIKWYDQKIEEMHKRVEAERRKQKKNARVMWLVKYEFHS